MKLILARHAVPLSAELRDNQVVLSDPDNHLSATGQTEAVELAAALPKRFCFNSVRLIASSMPRAVETMEPIESELGVMAERTPWLAERNFQFPAGTTVAESKRIQEQSHLNPEDKFPGGESRIDHRYRVGNWLRRFQTQIELGDERDTVVVCHGGTIEHLLMLLLGAPIEASAHVCVPCDTAHYHVLESFKAQDGRLVWALKEINVSWSPGRG